MAKITRALHTGISVYKMDESVEWYEKNLGFKKIKDDYVPPLKARIVFLSNGDYELELFQYDDPKPLPQERLMPNDDLQTVGTKHVAFEVDDMAGMKEKLVANDVEIAHEVQMEGNNVMFIHDNSGVLIELIQNN
jgi:methylmalonyl-CoA/ethylmalonyl-CoA epimerase